MTEAIDTTNSHGVFRFNLFGTLAEYERELIRGAGLSTARRRDRRGGRPPMIDTEKVEQILAALEAGAESVHEYCMRDNIEFLIAAPTPW